MPAQHHAEARAPDLQRLVEELCEHEMIPGMVVQLFYDGAVQQSAVAGAANAETREPMSLDAVYQIGSISKTFTATLAYVLSEKGILPIETRIADVFPELLAAGRQEYRDVDIRMLLSHTTGMPYSPLTEPDDAFLQALGPDLQRRRHEYVRAALRDAPVGTPGGHYEYSGGTIILAAMMEQRTKSSWEELMEKHVLRPLGLARARPVPGWKGSRKRAWGHHSSGGKLRPALFDHEMAVVHGPAGSMQMTAGELVHFAQAHFYNNPRRPQLLSRSSLTDMQKRSSVGDSANGWFVGWEGWSDYKTVWHGGDTSQARASLNFSPKYECAYTILVNASNEATSAAMERVEREIKTFLGEHLEGRQPELALRGLAHKPIAVTASSYFHNMDDYAPARATDGLLTTRWATDDELEQAWIEIDLGAVRPVGAVLIREELSPRVSAFVLALKRGSGDAYSTVASGRELGDEVVLQLSPTPARYVRLSLTAAHRGGPTISELQVFENSPY